MQIYKLYKKQGEGAKFLNEMKPKLTPKQLMLLSAFYNMSQERDYVDSPRKIKRSDIQYFQSENGNIGYPSDVFTFLISDIDSHYMKEENAEIQRQRDRERNK